MSPRFPPVARDDASVGFFDAAARGELAVRRCAECSSVLGPEARTCPTCGSAELDSLAVSGWGSLVSWAVVHQAPLPMLADAVPYVTALVELDEGPWLLMRLAGACDGELTVGELAVGARLRVGFARSGPPDAAAETLPYVTLAD